MSDAILAFIGAGNIAQAIIGGLVANGYAATKILAADPAESQLRQLPPGVRTAASGAEIVPAADVVVLCVKPDRAAGVAGEIADVIAGKLVISVAAGVPAGTLAAQLGSRTAIIRCMPNTPALVRQGVTGMFANNNVTDAQRRTGETVLASVGRVHWFDREALLDVVTAVSGSGPAYFFLVMEAMEQAAIALGLSPAVSRQLVVQTALGAAQMAQSNEDGPATLRKRVTSPGGTTEAAVDSLLAAGLIEDFDRAIAAAHRRALELAGTTSP